MHKAVQYLAAAGISFLKKKDDDSHTTTGWRSDLTSLMTYELNANGDRLALNYSSFSLEWVNGDQVSESLLLEGTSHDEAIQWILKTSTEKGLSKPFSYDLHYELPYGQITDNDTFHLEDRDRLNELIDIRTMAQEAIANALEVNGLQSQIRVWPHHFDTGAYAVVNAQLSIGFGLAIPDTMIDDFYLYVSGYGSNGSIETSGFATPQLGTIHSEGWKGIALPISGIDKDTAIAFFNEAITTYKNA